VFDDKKDSEKIRMHAEKDHEVTVKNSETWTIGEVFTPANGSPSRSTTIKNGDDQLTIEKGNQDHARQGGNLDHGGRIHNPCRGAEHGEHYAGLDKPCVPCHQPSAWAPSTSRAPPSMSARC